MTREPCGPAAAIFFWLGLRGIDPGMLTPNTRQLTYKTQSTMLEELNSYFTMLPGWRQSFIVWKWTYQNRTENFQVLPISRWKVSSYPEKLVNILGFARISSEEQSTSRLFNGLSVTNNCSLRITAQRLWYNNYDAIWYMPIMTSCFVFEAVTMQYGSGFTILHSKGRANRRSCFQVCVAEQFFVILLLFNIGNFPGRASR